MDVTHDSAPWLLLVFSLPARSASARVAIWRKIRRYGMVALRSSGYILPASAANQERMEWLATAIRAAKGQASVVQAHSFDDLPARRLKQMFSDVRTHDYQKLAQEVKRHLALPRARRNPGQLNRIRRRAAEVAEIDFFESPMRGRLEKLLDQAEESSRGPVERKAAGKFRKRSWMTRFRPGIDRVSSAWLIRRFIDPEARFVFGDRPEDDPAAIPFDMFGTEGFGHRGEDCTFETLCKQFGIRQARVKTIARIIHDADLGDDKFGRAEGLGLDRVLRGWAEQGIPDEELLQRGMDLIEGLYTALE